MIVSLAPPPPQRDPDGIYQHGLRVAQVENARIEMGASRALFDRIVSHGKFDPDSEFEYREWRMKMIAHGQVGSMGGMGQIMIRHNQVVAGLLAREGASAKPPSTFPRSEGYGTIDIADSFSSANTFADVKGFPRLSFRRNTHVPGGDADQPPKD